MHIILNTVCVCVCVCVHVCVCVCAHTCVCVCKLCLHMHTSLCVVPAHTYIGQFLHWNGRKMNNTKASYLGKFEEWSLIFPEKIHAEHGLWIR